MEHQQSTSIPEDLSQRFHDAVEPLAGAPGRVVHDIVAVLPPVKSRPGIDALLRRSVQLAGVTHPRLRDPGDAGQATLDLDDLDMAFAAEESQAAASGAVALLRSLHEVLARMVRRPLAGRMLAPVMAHSPYAMAFRRTPR